MINVVSSYYFRVQALNATQFSASYLRRSSIMKQNLDFVISTHDWQAQPAKQNPTIVQPRYIIIHHTGFKSVSSGTVDGGKKLARSIQQAHFSRGWIDSGHNFLNTVGGVVLEGRHGSIDALMHGHCVRSAHTVGQNSSPGIENEGNFSQQTMSAVQWNQLVKLVAALCALTGIPPAMIKAHRDFNKTECPGNWLYKQLPKLRAEVAARLKALPAEVP